MQGLAALRLITGRSQNGGLSPSALGLVAIIALGLLLRIHQIGAASLWYDEIFSAYWIHRPLSYLWTDGLIIETTPPLYYSLLKLWVAFAGDGDVALRLFSAAASTATIPLVFLLGAELATPAAGLLAALLFALSPMQIYYAQEARGYAMLPLAFALALLGLLRFLRAARCAGLITGRSGSMPPALLC